MRGARGKRGSAKRGRRRPRGQKAIEATHDSDDSSSGKSSKDQGFQSSPVLSRYPTRHSRAALAQCATLHSPLRNPVRCIKTTPGQQCTSQQSREDLIHHATSASSFSIPDRNTVYVPTNFGHFQSIRKDKAVTIVGNSVSAGSVNWSAPISKHQLDLDNLTSQLVSQCQGPQEVERIGPLPAFHQDLNDSYINRPEKSTVNNCVQNNSQCLSESHSFNIMEYAKKQQDDLDDDPEEVESALDPAFDCVNGHKVKIEIAPLLRAIFEKYGDITIGSDTKPSNFLSYYLESVCDIYGRLARTTFFYVTHIELTDMLDEVLHLERQKLNLGWLREKLEYISQTKISFHEYLSVKEEAAKNELSIGSLKEKLEVYKRELADLHHKTSLVQKKISAAEEEMVAKEAKSDQSKKVVLDIKARAISLVKQSLVHGLL